MRDPYRVLGVRRGATGDEIRRAYRRRAKVLHPDSAPASRREERTRRFQELQEAYALLSSPKLRRALDAARPSPWRRLLRRRRSDEEFVDEFLRNLLRSMMP